MTELLQPWTDEELNRKIVQSLSMHIAVIDRNGFVAEFFNRTDVADLCEGFFPDNQGRGLAILAVFS